MTYLIYGHRGYLGEHFVRFLEEKGEMVVKGEADIGDIEVVRKEVTMLVASGEGPHFVINAAGKTGRPNVDWCENHKAETLYANVTGPLVLAQACIEAGMSETSGPRLVHLGSGCVYDGYNDGKGWSEEDVPNFDGSYYSRTKACAEGALKEFPVLQLRLRMPIDAHDGPRNFISKIIKYEKVASVPNSMTVIEDFLPAAYELMRRGCVGIYNMTNPGLIDHKTILELYKEIADPHFSYTLVPMEELYVGHHVVAKRSNCQLDTSKLANEGIAMRPIEVAVRDCLERGFLK